MTFPWNSGIAFPWEKVVLFWTVGSQVASQVLTSGGNCCFLVGNPSGSYRETGAHVRGWEGKNGFDGEGKFPSQKSYNYGSAGDHRFM